MEKTVAYNRRAHFDYHILEKLIAGIALTGAEVKSIKLGHISLKESFVKIIGAEAYLINAHVSPYAFAHDKFTEPTRSRKLLLGRREIDSFIGKLKSGLTLVPLRVFVRSGLVKVEIVLAQGKKQYDKREVLRKKAVKREVEQVLKERSRQ